MKKRNTLAMGLGMLGIASALAATSAYAASDSTTTIRKGPRNDAQHQAVHAALLANDYAAFKTAIAQVQKPANAPEITEVVFAKMVEAEKLRQSGDMAGAEKILSALGFKTGPHGDGKGGRGTPPNLTDVQKTAWEQAHTLMEQGKRDEAKAVLTAAGITPPARSLINN